MRSGIWRFAVAPSDAAEKNRNIGAQLHSFTCIIVQKMFWKISFLYDLCLVRTKLFIPSAFWTTDTKFDNCCLRYITTCGKKIIQVHIYVLALNNCNGILVKSLSYLYEVVRTNFPTDFWTFRNF